MGFFHFKLGVLFMFLQIKVKISTRPFKSPILKTNKQNILYFQKKELARHLETET